MTGVCNAALYSYDCWKINFFFSGVWNMDGLLFVHRNEYYEKQKQKTKTEQKKETTLWC